jgi:hypothetical protein
MLYLFYQTRIYKPPISTEDKMYKHSNLGRPNIPEEDQKSCRLSLYLDEVDADLIKAIARRKGLALSVYLREMVLEDLNETCHQAIAKVSPTLAA